MNRPTNQNACNDRRSGALFGMAIGDALGAAVEFEPRGTFDPVVDFRSGGPHGLAPGEWTDDTSMALALADSLVSVGWDLHDQAERYVQWWQEGKYSVNDRCFDIGITTRGALASFLHSGDPQTCGPTHDRSSGNGSIMRLAPVPMFFVDLFPNNIEQLSIYAAESSLPTHASEKCLSACRYMSLILCGLMQGASRDDVLAPDWPPLIELRNLAPLDPAVEEVAGGSFRQKKRSEILGSGYVVKSLEAALWAFCNADDFEQAVLSAVNLGDDSDTTGAVCGQIAGAYWGRSGIPTRWIDGLGRLPMIEEAASKLISK